MEPLRSKQTFRQRLVRDYDAEVDDVIKYYELDKYPLQHTVTLAGAFKLKFDMPLDEHLYAVYVPNNSSIYISDYTINYGGMGTYQFDKFIKTLPRTTYIRKNQKLLAAIMFFRGALEPYIYAIYATDIINGLDKDPLIAAVIKRLDEIVFLPEHL